MSAAPPIMVEMIEGSAGLAIAPNRTICSGFADSGTPGYKRAMSRLRLYELS
ncbi:MAG: hypothetical protein OXF88_00385 [Rhodobacteraceae bacterium]|nr:hypothetical protein [Paracoccaceae bacterium]MCY4137467.1 hypothetical protein [Paracoccaceae bacterium]